MKVISLTMMHAHAAPASIANEVHTNVCFQLEKYERSSSRGLVKLRNPESRAKCKTANIPAGRTMLIGSPAASEPDSPNVNDTVVLAAKIERLISAPLKSTNRRRSFS